MEDLFKVSHDLIEPIEGLKTHIYKDSKGNDTVGRGHLCANGFSLAVCNLMYEEDIQAAINACQRDVPCFSKLDIPRQYVCVNLAFNMGIGGLLGFHKMLGFMESGDNENAAKELENSLEYEEVPNRVFPLIKILRTGQF